jgi:phospholipase/carboxylesterase
MYTKLSSNEDKAMNTDLCIPYIEVSSPQSEHRPILLLLHGKGTNELDLLDLAPSFISKYRVLVLRAPIQMGENEFAWFHTRYDQSVPIYDPAEAEVSRQLLIKFICQVSNKYQCLHKNIFLFGFSQGAIMSFGISLSNPDLIGGIACLSGRILQEHVDQAKPNKGTHSFPIFLSHGVNDEILDIRYARDAKVFLESLSVDLDYREYPMGHDITDVNFLDAKNWLMNLPCF